MNILNRRKLLREDMVSPVGINLPTGVLIENFIAREHLHKDYNYWYINLLTIIRNYIESIDGNSEDKIHILRTTKINYLIDGIVNDIEIMLENLISINAILYYPTYNTIIKKLPNIRKFDNTTTMRYWVDKKMSTIVTGIKSKLTDIHIERINYRLIPYNNSLITTHIPIDLHNFYRKKNVMLFESFTAKLKDRTEWYSKYHSIGSRDMSIFPFIERLHYILGDNVMIDEYPINIRKRLYDIAIQDNWTTLTSDYKIYTSLKKRDKELFNIYNSIKTFFH